MLFALLEKIKTDMKLLQGKGKEMVKEIDAKTLEGMLRSGGAVLIDVREPDEFRAGHIEGAVSLPLSVFAQKFHRDDFPAEKEIVLQCQGGVRSMKACNIVRELAEHEHVVNLAGGLNAWVGAGLPVTKT
ncbi:MAG: rhodanese-like domain-containing protein [Pseudobdellovibrionaceae bacterium]